MRSYAEKINITILGAHNCESKDSKLVSILIDDVLAIDAGALASSLSFAEQQKLKAILLTHQHYDHIRDIPAMGMNALLQHTTINIHSTQAVHDALAAHLLNDEIYPEFFEKPAENPIIKFTEIGPGSTWQIDGYRILAVQVNHSVPTVGYQVTSPDGKALFYTSDTGPGLAECWQHISPQLLIIEVTAPNRYTEFAHKSGHLTPGLLEEELKSFRKLKGYLPQVITVHMNPRQEKEIEAEIAEIARATGSHVRLAHEGMQIKL